MKKIIKIILCLGLFVASYAYAKVVVDPKPTPIAEPIISPVVDTVDPLLDYIAICESRNIAMAKNPNSTAKGRFQFLDGSWNYYGGRLWKGNLSSKDAFNFNDSTELANYAYSLDGVTPWLASSHCWLKLASDD